jgi:hypothetical protein
MPDTWQDTAKRLAAHPEFTFLEGMLVTNGNHTFRIGPFSGKPPESEGYYPVFNDPTWATVGVLLGMVVEAGYFDKWEELVIRGFYLENGPLPPAPVLGQALAELLLELWGET